MSPPTSVEDMHVNLTERLVVLPRAVAPKGVHLVAHRHRSVVDPAGPAFQVHWPAQHSARQPYVLSSSLCRIPWSQRRWPWWRKQREVQHLWAGRIRGQWSRRAQRRAVSPGEGSSCSFLRWQALKPPHYRSWEDIFRGDWRLPLFFIYVCRSMCTLLWGCSKYRTVSELLHQITDQRNLPILIYEKIHHVINWILIYLENSNAAFKKKKNYGNNVEIKWRF